MDEKTNMQTNAEIEAALREFEAQNKLSSQGEDKQVPTSESSTMVNFLIKHSGGIIKNKKIAEGTLLAFTILALAISFYLIISAEHSSTRKPDLQELEKMTGFIPSQFQKP